MKCTAEIITLARLAKEAGVSRSTAGLILNDKAEALRIAPETAARVRQTAERLGYLHNNAARQLKNQKTHQIAYVMTTSEQGRGMISPFVFSMIRYLQGYGYQTLIVDVTLKSNEVNPLFLERHFDGMVIEGTVPNQQFFEKWGDKHGVPYIYLNHDDMDKNHAGNDEKRIADFLIDELYARGFREIAFYFPRDVESNPLYPPDHIFFREKCLRQAIAAKGLTLYPDTVEQRRHGENTAAYLMTLPVPPECVIGYDAFHGIEFKHNIASLGLFVPCDVGLVVYESSMYTRAARLAGIRFDFAAIGKNLAEMILERIKTRENMENRLTSATLELEINGVALESLNHVSKKIRSRPT